ncbi:MAG: hypothetical protein LBT37_06345 [Lactobacillaceae bacterium]|jgi:hypothetical protein|nr:hypothetical protein [Lactobacillaceae bacterium]
MKSLTIITSNGEMVGLPQLQPENLKLMSNDDLEDLARTTKYLESGFKKVMTELKDRLDHNEDFEGVEYKERIKRSAPTDVNEIKEKFVNKYGWDAVELKSNAKLKKLYDGAINEDLEAITVENTTKIVSWK